MAVPRGLSRARDFLDERAGDNDQFLTIFINS
jgi:hypothetical protein